MSEPEQKQPTSQNQPIEIGLGPAKYKGPTEFLLPLVLGLISGAGAILALIIYTQQPSVVINPIISQAVTQTIAAQLTLTPTTPPTEISTTTLAPITCADYDIKITSPSSNTVFEEEVVEISGSYSVEPPGEIVLFTIVPPGGHNYWPQDPVRVDVRNKSWQGKLILVGEPPIELDAMVAIMGESGRALYDYYWKVGGETGEWPAIEKLTDDIVECDRISVVRTK
jgi:hypothetical protein